MNHRNKVIFFNLIQPLKNHSLSTECIFKPGKNWTYGFQTSCEAYVYYYPYNAATPTKCVSQPDENAVKSVIHTYWLDSNLTTLMNLSATTIGEAANILNDENTILHDLHYTSQKTCSSEDLGPYISCQIENIVNTGIRKAHNLIELYDGQRHDGQLHGRCSYSQRDDKILNPYDLMLGPNWIPNSQTYWGLPRFNFSDDMIFDRQECKGVIRAFKTHRFSKKNKFLKVYMNDVQKFFESF